MRMENIRKHLHIVLLFFWPFFCAMVLLLLTGHKFDIDILAPVWNDEVGWYVQVDAVKTYGMPLGYNGYNATHAQIGTFGPWGAAVLLPYALFGKFFGWTLHSMAIANMFYLGLALSLFGILTKVGIKQTIWMMGLYACCFITVGYSLTSMSEGVRYAAGLALAGLVVFYERKTRNDKLVASYKDGMLLLFTTIYILYAVNLYLIYALFIPVFCWIFSRRKNLAFRITISLCVTVIVTAGEQMILSMICAPYSQSAFEKFYSVFKEQGFYQMVVYIIKNTFTNLETINPPVVLQSADHTLWLYFIVYIAATGVAVMAVFREQSFYILFRAYILVGLLIGYCTLYTGSGWTLCRGTNAALLIATMMLCIEEQVREKYSKIWIVGLTLIGSIQIWDYYSAMIDDRMSVAVYEEQILKEKEILSEVIQLSAANGRWDNTIAYYGGCDYGYLSIPTGAGLNWMSCGGVNENAKYVLIRTGTEDIETYIQINLNAGHKRIHQDDMFVVLEKQKIGF